MTTAADLQRIIDYALAKQADRRVLALPIPHVLIGNRLLSRYLVREFAINELGERDRVIKRTHPHYSEVDIWPGAKIEQARQIASDFQRLGAHRLVVGILGFDNFAARAQDALLKTFEEEADWRLYITSSRVDRLASTIRSRCHCWQVPDLPWDDKVILLAWAGYGNRKRVENALDLARGNIDRAYTWLRDSTANDVLDKWPEGPSKMIHLLADQTRELKPAALDAIYVCFKRFLLWSRVGRAALPKLKKLPEQFQASLMLRHYLLDEFLVLVSETLYGEVILDG